MDVSGIDILGHAHEFLRMWQRDDGAAICLVNPTALGEDPMLLGIALADCVRHGAKAYAQVYGLSEDEALIWIWRGFDAERNSPTDVPTPLGSKGN